MSKATSYIEVLKMNKHPEGGYYAQTYASPDVFKKADGETRPLSTSIYFLLEKDDVSHFHRLQSDELWFFHDGEPLNIYMIDTEGTLRVETLGLDLEAGQRPQLLVPAGVIFGSAPLSDTPDGFSLVGCVVSYGFDFDDFELFERDALTEAYPDHADIIEKLTL
ncbi:cupin domain-containing protein [Fusibacter sp. JL298sf-3]